MAHPLPYRGPLYIFSGGRIPGRLFKVFGGGTNCFAMFYSCHRVISCRNLLCYFSGPPLLILKVARVVTKGIEKYPGKE